MFRFRLILWWDPLVGQIIFQFFFLFFHWRCTRDKSKTYLGQVKNILVPSTSRVSLHVCVCVHTRVLPPPLPLSSFSAFLCTTRKMHWHVLISVNSNIWTPLSCFWLGSANGRHRWEIRRWEIRRWEERVLGYLSPAVLSASLRSWQRLMSSELLWTAHFRGSSSPYPSDPKVVIVAWHCWLHPACERSLYQTLVKPFWACLLLPSGNPDLWCVHLSHINPWLSCLGSRRPVTFTLVHLNLNHMLSRSCHLILVVYSVFSLGY